MGYFPVLELGGQHTDLIRNRLLELGYNTKVVPSCTPLSQMQDADGFILSGSWKSVNVDRYVIDPAIYDSGKRVLGICFGMQNMVQRYGGEVLHGGSEYGRTRVRLITPHPIFDGIPRDFIAWNNHGDYVKTRRPIKLLAISERNIPAAVAVDDHVAVQYHPELTHTEYGKMFFDNFARLCGAKPVRAQKEFDAQMYLQRAIERVKDEVGGRKAVCLVSGGVDSSVAYGIAIEACADVTGVHLDTGLQRKGEAAWVKDTLERHYGKNIIVIDCSEKIFRALGGLKNDREKRLAFQAVYDELWTEAAKQLSVDPKNLIYVQGTLQTDKKESRTASGEEAEIKVHHNTGNKPEKTTEPLDQLSKGEARAIARVAGLPAEISERQPFPGPGLSLRLINALYDPDEMLKTAVGDIARKYGLTGHVLPVKTVGLKGDGRAFQHTALLYGESDWKSMFAAHKRLAEETDICRTVYMHPEWNIRETKPEKLAYANRGLEFSRANIRIVQIATQIVEEEFARYGVKPKQMPVIVFPGYSGIVIASRPVESIDFRSVMPLSIPGEVPWELSRSIVKRLKESGLQPDAYVEDVSTKPAATTEWE